MRGEREREERKGNRERREEKEERDKGITLTPIAMAVFKLTSWPRRMEPPP